MAKHKHTLKTLGLVDDGRLKLDPTYAHTRNDFRVITDNVNGYYVVHGSNFPSRVAPLYETMTYIRIGKVTHVISGVSIGEYMNPHEDEPTLVGFAANSLANVASVTLLRLEQLDKANKKRGGRGDS